MIENIGEVISADSQRFEAECRHLYGAPALGSFVRVEGAERLTFTWACNYDLRIGLEAAGLGLAFGVTSYFLLRSRWRGRAKLAAASASK